jgi:hypothetical protein
MSTINLELSRYLDSPVCTLGRLGIMGARPQWFTMERPWVPGGKGGKRFRSRVPAGRYRIERHSSETYPRSFALVAPALGVWRWPWEVPGGDGRSAILIHAGNWVHELAGCIAPGKEVGRDAQGRWMVRRSRDAMNELNQLLTGAIEISLEIHDVQEQ